MVGVPEAVGAELLLQGPTRDHRFPSWVLSGCDPDPHRPDHSGRWTTRVVLLCISTAAPAVATAIRLAAVKPAVKLLFITGARAAGGRALARVHNKYMT